MRVLVTGAAGFTGRHLIPLLRGRGDRVHALAADLTDAPALAAEVSDARPQAAVHLAARSFVAGEDVAAFYRVNQLGTFALLDALAAAAPGIPVLLASSAQVYGAGAAGLLDEAAATRPSNHYGVSKLAMELGASLWADRLRVLIARPFNYTGVGQAARFLLPKIVDHFARRAPAIELGDTRVRRDFGDVRAVVSAYAALIGGEASPATVNIATGRLHSVDEVLAILTRITGHRMAVRTDPALLRAGDPAELGGDNARLRALLPDWSPRPLEDTLRWMLDAAQV